MCTWLVREQLLDRVEALPRLVICVAVGAVVYTALALVLDRRLYGETLELLGHLRPGSRREPTPET